MAIFAVHCSEIQNNAAVFAEKNSKSNRILKELQKLEDQKIHTLLLILGYDQEFIGTVEARICKIRTEYMKERLSQKQEGYDHAKELKQYKIGNENALEYIKKLLIKWNIEPTSIDIAMQCINEMEGSRGNVQTTTEYKFCDEHRDFYIVEGEKIMLTIAADDCV